MMVDDDRVRLAEQRLAEWIAAKPLCSHDGDGGLSCTRDPVHPGLHYDARRRKSWRD